MSSRSHQPALTENNLTARDFKIDAGLQVGRVVITAHSKPACTQRESYTRTSHVLRSTILPLMSDDAAIKQRNKTMQCGTRLQHAGGGALIPPPSLFSSLFVNYCQ